MRFSNLLVIFAICLAAICGAAFAWFVPLYSAGPKIDYSVDVSRVGMISGAVLPATWTPDFDPQQPHESLPFPWPKKYITRFNQPFSPHHFAENMVALCDAKERYRNDANYGRIIDYLLTQLASYTRRANGGRYVIYNFAYGVNGITLPRKWVSPYGNAAAASGLMAHYRCTRDKRYLELARSYLEPLMVPTERFAHEYWTTIEDENGDLWFEEYPIKADRPSHVLNGHLFVIFSLYQLNQFLERDDIDKVIRRAVKTVRNNLHRYRVPGQKLRYDLLDPDKADYDVERTIGEVRALYEITGDAFFRDMANLFEADLSAVSG